MKDRIYDEIDQEMKGYILASMAKLIVAYERRNNELSKPSEDDIEEVKRLKMERKQLLDEYNMNIKAEGDIK
jgi:cell division protein FtsB